MWYILEKDNQLQQLFFNQKKNYPYYGRIFWKRNELKSVKETNQCFYRIVNQNKIYANKGQSIISELLRSSVIKHK
jgi:hypothetical protein